MKHRVYGRHLSRDKNERTALFKSLVRSLFLEEKIQTTEAKAKAIKGLVDKVINQAKRPQGDRLVSQFITDKEVSKKLTSDIAKRFNTRTSGYTSLIKLGRRKGDGAMVVLMSLVEGKKSKVEGAKEVKAKAAHKIEKVGDTALAETAEPKETKAVKKEIAK